MESYLQGAPGAPDPTAQPAGQSFEPGGRSNMGVMMLNVPFLKGSRQNGGVDGAGVSVGCPRTRDALGHAAWSWPRP